MILDRTIELIINRFYIHGVELWRVNHEPHINGSGRHLSEMADLVGLSRHTGRFCSVKLKEHDSLLTPIEKEWVGKISSYDGMPFIAYVAQDKVLISEFENIGTIKGEKKHNEAEQDRKKGIILHSGLYYRQRKRWELINYMPVVTIGNEGRMR